MGGIRTLAAAINRPNDLAGRPLHQLEYHRIIKTHLHIPVALPVELSLQSNEWDSNPRPTGWNNVKHIADCVFLNFL